MGNLPLVPIPVLGVIRFHLGRILSKMSFWTAAVTRPQQEERAAHHVESQGFKFWLPRIIEFSDSGLARRSLLFPGYIFVQVRDGWHSLLSTRGIARLFVCNENIVRMRDSDVERLLELEGDDGTVHLPSPFKKGESVVVGGGGAFDGKVGLYSGQTVEGRCLVLLSLLGRRVVKELPEKYLSAA